ncbi:MAG: ABC transporter permease [Methanoculleus sp.]|jgi:ABC-type antimicrobial peptide transport system permease subunit|nr:ABC transporter permease [Candidatus Moranbacteria bacterium]
MSEFIISISLALRTLSGNKIRTIFSLLGIVIGVTSVILILSLGNGLKDFVNSQVEAFGTDIIEIEIKVPQTSQISSQNISGMVGGMQITTLKIEDAEEVSNLPNLGPWYAGILGQEIMGYEGKTDHFYIFGITAGMPEADSGFEIVSGRFFSESEDEGLRQVVVLGSKAEEYFFPNEEALGKDIKIGNQKYRVIGVAKPRGGMGGVFDYDEIVYMPARTLQKKVMGIDHIQFIIYKVENMDVVDQTIAQMEMVMRDRHGIEYKNEEDKKKKLKDDFAIISIAEAKEIIDNVFVIINVLLVGLASISLVVGGVGIMNIMYVAVTERTKEIGLRKSVGAKNSDILLQFIFESVFLTFIGGFMGILIGYILSKIITQFAQNAGFFVEFSVTWYSILIGFGFSAAVGIIFGYYPARKASRLSPMEALRKE